MPTRPTLRLSGAIPLALLVALPLAAQEVALPADLYAAAAARPLAQPVADGVPIDVVDEGGKPVPGTAVVVVDQTAVPRMQRMLVGAAVRARFGGSNANNNLALAALHGTRYVTDDKGRAKVLRARRGVAMAIDGRAVAFVGFASRDGQEPRAVRLEFVPPKGIDVLVVDPRGKPVAGVPVALVQHYGHSGRFPMFNQPTGADGRVRLDHSRWHFGGSGMEFFVEPWVPLTSKVGVRVDVKNHVNDPNNPIRLQLPECGQVRVYATDAGRRPLSGLDDILLAVGPRTGWRATFHSGKVERDHATFDFVEVGAEVTVWCKYKGSERPTRVTAAGPRHPREQRVLALDGITAPVQIHLTLLDPAGAPVKDEEVGVIFGADRFMEGRTMSTDAEGRLTVLIPDSMPEAEEGAMTVVRRGPGHRLVYLGAARVPLTELRRRSDLGEVRLQEEPLLVRGTVVDSGGAPVRGVRITADGRYWIGESGGRSTSGASKFFRHDVLTGADGRFELRELGEERSELKLGVVTTDGRRYFVVSGEVAEPGAKDHKLVVGLTSRIEGSFAGVPADVEFSGGVDLLDANGEKVQGVWMQNRRGGGFEVLSCPPGTYKLAFKLPASGEAFLVVDGVVVEAGKPCRDQRLTGIDLTKHGKLIRIEVLDPGGKPASGVNVNLTRKAEGGGTYTHGYGLSDGKISLFVPPEGAKVSVTSETGLYRAVVFPQLKTDEKVQLQSGFPVEVRVTNLPKLPPEVTISVGAWCFRPVDGFGAHHSYGMYLDRKGKAAFRVGVPGVYRLSLHPRVEAGRGTRAVAAGPQQELRYEFEIGAKLAKEKDPKPKVVQLTFEDGDLALLEELAEQAVEQAGGKRK